MEKKSSFADLDKVKLEELEEKIIAGIIEIEMDPRKQWAAPMMSKPLLEKALELVQRSAKFKIGDYAVDKFGVMFHATDRSERDILNQNKDKWGFRLATESEIEAYYHGN